LTTLSKSEIEDELRDSKKWLLDNGFYKGSRFFQPPYADFNSSVLDIASDYYKMVSTYSYQYPIAPPATVNNPLTITKVSQQNDLTDLKTVVDITADEKGLTPLTFHSNNMISANDFRTLLEYIKGKGSSLQVITFSDMWEILKTQNSRDFLPVENHGIATFSGDGSTTTFNINHGLKAVPDRVHVNNYGGGTVTTNRIARVNAGASTITVVYDTAPASGTDNIKLSWSAKANP